MSAVHDVNLTAEIRHALNDAQAGIEHSAMFALLGERIGALPEDVTLPAASTVFQLIQRGGQETPCSQDALFAEMREDFPTYCTRYAILAMTTCCEECLQRLLLTARLAVAAVQQRRLTTGKQFHQIREAWRKEIRRTSVDGLVPKILFAVGKGSATVTGLEWFRSAYSIKRCLTHRGGRVGPDDVGDDETLEVVWRKPVLEVNSQEVAALPFKVQEGQLLSVGFTDECRSWRLGEAVQLTAQECQHVGLSLILFCTEFGNLLQAALLDLFGVQPHQ